MPRQFKDQLGYFTFAQNNKETDYLRLAYLQALSLKRFMPKSLYAVAVDAETKKQLTDTQKSIFDYVIDIPQNDAAEQNWKLNNEWKLYQLTPFKETIKVEADLFFTRDINHWINGFRTRDIILTTKIVNFRNEEVFDKVYRKQFIDNNLPMVYSGFSYFRYTKTMAEFFSICKNLTIHWKEFTQTLKGEFSQPTTDVLYALAAKMIGIENCTNPILNYPKMVHMKGAINGFESNADWTEKLYGQLDEDCNLLVGFTRQIYPFHYYIKDWPTKEFEEKYERCYRRVL